LSYAITDLGTLGGTGSNGYALNDFAQVAGPSLTQDNLASHTFLWTNGAMADLGTLDGSHSIARALSTTRATW
jgi:probable HAF family extracellular repeat protein